jgi:hypothetical protein
MKHDTCHPERGICIAKRSEYGVEGSLRSDPPSRGALRADSIEGSRKQD